MENRIIRISAAAGKMWLAFVVALLGWMENAWGESVMTDPFPETEDWQGLVWHMKANPEWSYPSDPTGTFSGPNPGPGPEWASLESVSWCTAEGRNKLVNLVIPKTLNWTHSYPAWPGNAWVTPLTVIEAGVFKNRKEIETVVFGDVPGVSVGVTNIGSGAFSNCTKMVSCTLPPYYAAWDASHRNLARIGNRCFYGCSSLTNMVIPDGVTVFGNQVLAQCTSLVTATLGKGITRIPPGTFEGCSSLRSVTLRGNITEIASNAFYGCTALTNIVIPSTVTNIGPNAFGGCTNLVSIEVKGKAGGITSIDGVLYACTGATPGEPTVLVKYPAAKESNFLEIPATVTKLEDGSLANIRLAAVLFLGDQPEWTREVFEGSQFIIYCPNGYDWGRDSGRTWDPIPWFSFPRFGIETNGVTWLYEISDGCLWIATVADGKATLTRGTLLPADRTGLVEAPATLHGHPVTSVGTGAFSWAATYYQYWAERFDTHADNWMPVTLSLPDGVTSIAPSTFQYCGHLVSVGIPASVSEIGASAFEQCKQLEHVAIPGGVVSIADKTFYECPALQSVKLPEGLQSIGASAFGGCTNLADVAIPAGVQYIGSFAFAQCAIESAAWPQGVNTIGWGTFRQCTNLASVELPGTVRQIGPYAFGECSNLVAIAIPEGVQGIGEGAFRGSGLEEVAIPASVETIGTGAFNECSGLQAFQVAPGNMYFSSENGVLFDKGKTTLCQYPGGKGGAYAIPDGVADIRDDAFSGCSGLAGVTIPGSVTNIGAFAFGRCTGLADVAIPGSVTDIGEQAFYGCESLAAVDIGDGVENIGLWAFAACSALREVAIPDSVSGIGQEAFIYCHSALYDIQRVPGALLVDGWAVGSQSPSGKLDLTGIRGLAEGAFRSCNALTEVTLPEGLADIAAWAFGYCKGLASLASVTIPDSVTSIGTAAFYGCSGLSSVSIPSSVTSIGNMAFSECTGLSELTIPGNVTNIDIWAFSDCTGLVGVAIADGVETIGDYAFYQCSQLASVTLPESVKSVGGGAFGCCYKLKTLYLPASWEGTSKLRNTGVPADCRIVYYDPVDEGETGTPVAVPHAWLLSHAPSILAACGDDYEAAATAPAANGRPVWECYAADISTTDPAADFKATLALEYGRWVPKPVPDRRPGRAYAVEGSPALGDAAAWGPVADDSRFFRVKVSLPEE